jgi:choline trimethylamine-lyase
VVNKSETKDARNNGKPTFGASPRILKLRENYFNTKATMCVDRDVLYTESFKQTTGERMEIRRAKATRYVLENIPVTIQDDELIVGSPNPKVRATAAYPELGAQWVIRELDNFETRDQDPLVVTDETKRILREELFPYWEDKNLCFICLKQMNQAQRELIEKGQLFSYWFENATGHLSPTWDWVIAKGIEGIKQDALEKLAQYDPKRYKHLDKIDFLNAIVIVCDGMIAYGKRYAEKARDMAAQEKDPLRKNELEKIAEVCDQVPAKPARNFREVLQFVYFIQVITYVESKGFACGPDRLDQYAYPYYKNDIASGSLTKDEAQELLDCLWIKLGEITHFNSTAAAMFYPGYMPFQVLDVGGLDADGNDATNDLSYMCLKATKDTRMTQPSVVAVFNQHSPQKFYYAAIETLKAGAGGIPAFVFAENGMPDLAQRNITIEDQRKGAAHGCVTFCSVGSESGVEGGITNLALELEKTLLNGVSRMIGEQVGPATGDPTIFKTFDDFMEAYKKQIKYTTQLLIESTMVMWRVHEEDFPEHLESIVMKGCVEHATRAKAPVGLGAKYPPGVGILPVGLPTVANSLAAIKKFVYDEKKITMAQLLEALEANFEGYEDLRQMLINGAPKYGNDDDYVDLIAKEVHDFMFDCFSEFRDEEGHKVNPNFNIINSHVPMGYLVGATPDGRFASTPLGDNLSPVSGTVKNSVTAVLKSVTKLTPEYQAVTLLNLRFTPQALEGENADKFITLVKTYWSLGGYHAQFNFVDQETLIEAQQNPENYKDLMVRVAGFSAYFTQLCKDSQNDIIARTIHETV